MYADMSAFASEFVTITPDNPRAMKSQDLKALLEVFNKQITEYEYNAFVLVRNRNWVEQIKELLPEQSTIFVVGSGHLLGDDGLITLLKDRGFKVKPVKK
jgi:uncharacterized protein YbaP (TraB family)